MSGENANKAQGHVDAVNRAKNERLDRHPGKGLNDANVLSFICSSSTLRYSGAFGQQTATCIQIMPRCCPANAAWTFSLADTPFMIPKVPACAARPRKVSQFPRYDA